MHALIGQLQVDEMREILFQILRGEFVSVQSELRRRYNQFLKQMKTSDDQDAGTQRRTTPQLFELMEEAKRKRQERRALELQRKRAAEERERRKYLAELVERFPETWEEVEGLTGEMTSASYERAVELLVDLSDAYDQAGRFEEFETRFSSYVSKHKRKSSLTRKMREAGLMPSSPR